jgi:hypothetical protein
MATETQEQGKLLSIEKRMYNGAHETWAEGPNGVQYKFNVKFDLGTSETEGVAMSPSVGPKWTIGGTFTYTKKVSDKGYISIKGMKDVNSTYGKANAPAVAGTNKWGNDPFENACISMEASLESAATLLRKNVMATPNNLAEAEYGLELVAKKFYDYIVYNLTLDIKDRNARIIRASALKRAVDLYEVKVFDIKNSDDVVARAKKIEEFIIKSCK